MNTSFETLSVLVLGSGEIARYLVRLAHMLDYPVKICAKDAAQHQWPIEVTQYFHTFSDRPWTLPAQTHAIIAQGHSGDAESVAALLNHGAEHVYLIASARRAHDVIHTALPLLKETDSIEQRFSSPAGLGLGGQSSGEIALSVLAEIQLRHYQQDSCFPLSDRPININTNNSAVTDSTQCPGKRP